MKNLILVLAFLLLCPSCAVKAPSKDVKPQVEIETPPIKIDDYVKIEIKSLEGFSESQELRMRKIIANTEKVINSTEFHKEVLNWYHNKKLQFFDTKDSNEQVLEKILSKDWVLEYRLEKMKSNVVGYTYPSVEWIAFNKSLFDKKKESEISQNICHEYGGHKLGRYSHSYNSTKNRPYSVPYGIGFLCKKYYKD